MQPRTRDRLIIAGRREKGREIVVTGTATAIKRGHGQPLSYRTQRGLSWGRTPKMSDLALAILATVLIEPITHTFADGFRCGDIAWSLCLPFYRQVVTKWSSSWELNYGQVRRWVEKQLRDRQPRPSGETVLAACQGYEVRCPAYPTPAEYVRLVQTDGDLELAYWDHAEWKTDDDCECIGAIFATISQVAAGNGEGLVHILLPKPVPVKPARRRRTAKRVEGDILRDIREVEVALEPEALTCDGERPEAEVSRLRRQLQAKRRQLVAELGREPDEAEIWPELYGEQHVEDCHEG